MAELDDVGISTEPPKRGPGRPPLNEGGGETVPLAIRIAERHFTELRRLIAAGHGPTLADAVRYLVDESAGAAR